MDARTASHVIGALILAEMFGGALVNFGLEAPLFGEPGFLVAAAPHAPQIALAALLGIATRALSVGIAIAAFPVFRRYSEAMALWFVALAVVGLSAAAVENMNVMSMLSLSEAFIKAGGADRAQFDSLRIVVASSRNWAHFIGLILVGCTILTMYATLLRFALVPRVLAAFGLLAALLQMTVIAMPLFGGRVVFPLLAPLGVSQLLLALWLIFRGFREPGAPLGGVVGSPQQQ